MWTLFTCCSCLSSQSVDVVDSELYTCEISWHGVDVYLSLRNYTVSVKNGLITTISVFNLLTSFCNYITFYYWLFSGITFTALFLFFWSFQCRVLKTDNMEMYLKLVLWLQSDATETHSLYSSVIASLNPSPKLAVLSEWERCHIRSPISITAKCKKAPPK